MPSQGAHGSSDVLQGLMAAWFVLVDAKPGDIAAIKRLLPNSELHFGQVDAFPTISTPLLRGKAGEVEATAAAGDLVEQLNFTLRIFYLPTAHIELRGIGYEQDGKVHRSMFGAGGAYGVSGGTAVGLPGHAGLPPRTRAERLLTLMEREPERHIARALSSHPATWPAMTQAYETIVGMMSLNEKPEEARRDWKNLVERGWLTEQESSAFYHTAAYYRHGYPKSPIRHGVEMSIEDARALLQRLFEKFIDEREPA
jgi:hypothetical protein